MPIGDFLIDAPPARPKDVVVNEVEIFLLKGGVMVRTDNHQELHEALDSLKEDLHDLRQDLRNVTHSAVDTGRDKASHMSHDINKQIHQAADKIEKKAGEHPLQTAGIALAIGFILGKLLPLGGK